jgi:hypothetical protein
MTGLIFQYSKNKCKKFGMAFRRLRMRSSSHTIYPAKVPYAFFIASFRFTAAGQPRGLNPSAERPRPCGSDTETGRAVWLACQSLLGFPWLAFRR